jgi:hypothetical protein
MLFKSTISSFDFNSLGYSQYIIIPPEVVQDMLKIAPDKRVRCMLDGKIEHYCAMLPKDGFHYILLNKSLMKKLSWSIGDTVSVQIEKQELKYGIPISEEMEEVLNSDYEGYEYFEALTPGAQRSLIHVINKYKNPQLRIDRSIILLRHLVLRKGNLDFKILGTQFKEGL